MGKNTKKYLSGERRYLNEGHACAYSTPKACVGTTQTSHVRMVFIIKTDTGFSKSVQERITLIDDCAPIADDFASLSQNAE